VCVYIYIYIILIPVLQGCYEDPPDTRTLGINPGNYDPATITPTICSQLCGQTGYSYAGLSAGKVCLCGQTLPPNSVSASLCTQSCPGDNTAKCGSSASSYYASVYSASAVLTGFVISPPSNVKLLSFIIYLLKKCTFFLN